MKRRLEQSALVFLKSIWQVRDGYNLSSRALKITFVYVLRRHKLKGSVFGVLTDETKVLRFRNKNNNVVPKQTKQMSLESEVY